MYTEKDIELLIQQSQEDNKKCDVVRLSDEFNLCFARAKEEVEENATGVVNGSMIGSIASFTVCAGLGLLGLKAAAFVAGGAATGAAVGYGISKLVNK